MSAVFAREDHIADLTGPDRSQDVSLFAVPHSGAGRCLPYGSDRTQWSRPWPERRPCSRLKSIILYFRLLPPPICRTVILPWTFTAATGLLLMVARSDFSGVVVVISSISRYRHYLFYPEKSGLYFLIAIISDPSVDLADHALEELDGLAVLLQGDDRLLLSRRSAAGYDPVSFILPSLRVTCLRYPP